MCFLFYHLLRFSPDTLDKDYDDLTQHGQLLDGQIVYVIRLSMTSARLIYKFTAPNGKIIRRIITVRNSQIIQKNVGKKVKILYLDPQRNVIL